MNLSEIAVSYAQAGLSVIPTGPDKRAVIPEWGPFQKAIADRPLVEKWFFNGRNIAVIGGRVSGNAEFLDFDLQAVAFEEWASLVSEQDPDLASRLLKEKSPHGIHIAYRCHEVTIPGNTKLASRPDESGKPICLIETRGEGGYCIVSPSTGYELRQGDFLNLPLITATERQVLIESARACNQWFSPQEVYRGPATQKNHGDLLPGTDFDNRGDLRALLEKHGWKSRGLGHDGRERWLRPGKDRGHSATLTDGKKFYVFSSNSHPFQECRIYSPFAVYTLLEHDGDFSKAARALSEEGYGENTSCSIQLSDFTDLANALRFAREHDGKIRYCHKFGKWFHWVGTRWTIDEAGEIWRTAKNHILGMIERAVDIKDNKTRSDYLKEMAKLQNEKKQAAMVNMARHLENIFVTSESLDKDLLLFNCETGTFDLRNFKYLPHTPEHLITKIAPFTIADTADCPKWRAHMDLIMNGNRELIGFLQRAFGSCLVGDNRDRKLFLLWGAGANGKSVTLETIHSILGDYAMKTPAETLLVKRFETIPNDLARLNGARFVYTSEVADGKKMAEALVKELSGDRYIQARFMRGEWFDIPITFKIFLATNHLPTIRGTDPAIWDRIMLIPFNVRIPEGQRRPREELIDEFQIEGPGILKWLLDGCYEWLHNGLNPPPDVKAANTAYQSQMDTLKQFIEDECILGDRMEARSADLYLRYEKWARDNGDDPIKKTSFGKRLKEKGFRDIRDNQGLRAWKGIGLLQENNS